MIKTLQALVDSVHKAHLEAPEKPIQKATYQNGDINVEIISLGQNGDIVIYKWVDEVKVYRCIFTGSVDEAKEFISNKEW